MTGLLLVGGASRRMGFDKALLEIEGLPLWRRQADILASVCTEIHVAAPARPEWLPKTVAFLSDASGDGPMAGILAGLEISRHGVLALAVDMPRMSVHCLKAISAQSVAGCGVIPVCGGHLEPLAAVYPASALPLGRIRAAAGDFALHRWAAELETLGLMRQWTVPDQLAACFTNTNTPDEWRGVLP